MTKFSANILLLISFYTLSAQQQFTDPKATEQWKPVPEDVTPGQGTAPPSDAIILLGNDTSLSMWESAKNEKVRWHYDNGILTVRKKTGDIRTRKAFGDCQLHIEWRSPQEVSGRGQGRGNSGVYLMERYEVQVLDSYNNPTYSNGQAASIYKQHIPLVNACLPPGEWQTYDIIWKAPSFHPDGSLKAPAYITVLHNGVLVQNHVKIKGTTKFIGAPSYQTHPEQLPLMLQDHGNPVSYRNIWIREL